MRPSEGAGLFWGQVHIHARILDLTTTKTKPRRVPLTIKAIEILLDIMPEKYDDKAPVFYRIKFLQPFKGGQMYSSAGRLTTL